MQPAWTICCSARHTHHYGRVTNRQTGAQHSASKDNLQVILCNCTQPPMEESACKMAQADSSDVLHPAPVTPTFEPPRQALNYARKMQRLCMPTSLKSMRNDSIHYHAPFTPHKHADIQLHVHCPTQLRYSPLKLVTLSPALLLTGSLGDVSASSSCRMLAGWPACSAAAAAAAVGEHLLLQQCCRPCLSASSRVLRSSACSCCVAAVLSAAAGSK